MISRFENDFDNLTRRDELLRAIATLKQQLESYPELSKGLNRLKGTTDEFDDLLGRNILLRLPVLCRDLFILSEYLELLQQYRVTTRITPGAAVTLPGRPITYTLQVKNQGTVATTYLTTLSAPELLEGQFFTPTLQPGEVFEVPLAVTPTETGFYPLAGQVTALDVPLPVQASANASLKVVDAAIQVTVVKANPAFVETGHSSTNMSAHVANIANWRMSGIGTTEVLAPDGTTVYSGTQPVTIALNEVQNSFDLGELETSGFAAGIYTITFKVDILEPAPLSGLSSLGSGLFSVGQGIQAKVKVEPEVVLPGNPVVTTTITTERTSFGADGLGSIVGGTPSLTQTIELVAPTNASKNNPPVGVPLHLEAGTYDVIITDGAVRKSASGAWYDTVRVSVYYTTPLAAEYWLGYGVDAANGGSATPYEALAQNRNKFVRIYLPQEASLYLWIPDDSPTDSSGSITLTVRRMYEASTHISRRIEGALGLAIPRQEAETAAFANWVSDNGCTACHVQSQALVGFSEA